MKKIIFCIISICLACFLFGCQDKTDIIKCELPMILVGGECCMDENSNSICDEFDVKEPEETEVQEGEEPEEEGEEPEEEEVEEIEEEVEEETEEKKETTMDVRKLKLEIIKKFNSEDMHSFEEMERENITGIHKTYDVLESSDGRFYILQIKKEHNFLHYYSNFSNFVNRMHELDIKNEKIALDAAISAISTSMNEYDYYYEPKLKEHTISNSTMFTESYSIMFIDPKGMAMDSYGEVKSIIWCTPELLVEVYPSKYIPFTYYGAAPVVKERMKSVDKQHEEDVIKGSKEIIDICEKAEK